MKMVNKLKRLISKKSAEKVISTQTIADLQDELKILQARYELVLQNNKYWKRQAKKYRKLCAKMLERQVFNK